MEPVKPKGNKLLPANAYTKLAPGEVYQPIVRAEDRRAEVTTWSISLGLLMVLIFSAACIYMALRAGNAIEAAIPIAILAIFFGKMRKVRSTILENVIVQSVGQAAGVVAAGAAFLIPALYINGLQVAWWQIFLACMIGGVLGIVLIIPLRKYFVKDLHGDLPFPEATAINEILVSGESTSASSGKILLIAFAIGASYDFLVEAFHLWNPTMTSATLLGSFGTSMSALRMDISMTGLAALFGLGYIIGLRYAAIIAGGSVLAWLVLVPTIFHFGSQSTLPFQYAGHSYAIGQMSSAAIFGAFVKNIGIGAIAVAGIIGILRMGKIIGSSLSLGFKGLRSGAGSEQATRTQLDMNPRNVLLLQLGSALLMALIFFVVAVSTVDAETGASYSTSQSLLYAGVGAGVGFLLSFLFTPVGAQAIAIVGVNPVSGMTLITVVLTILALVGVGLRGTGGMFIALIAGTAVCTALSTSGALITDFKIGYWIGATPRNQQVWKFLGIAMASLVVAFVIPIMDSGYHFLVPNESGQMVSNTQVLPAPQANMIAAVAKGLLSDPSNQPWMLYGIGGIIAVLLYLSSVPILAFALGMYLPISINLPVLFGAFVAWIVSRTGGSEEVRQARSEQGTLIASGLMAGAAIFGIITAVLRQVVLGAPIQYLSVGEKFWVETAASGDLYLRSQEQHWYEGFTGQAISLGMYLVLAVACFLLARKGAAWALSEQKSSATTEVAAQDRPAEG